MKTKTSKAAKNYDGLWSSTFEVEIAKGCKDDAAAEFAGRVVSQRRQADERDAQRPGLPPHETAIEHNQRYISIRNGHSYDEATALMFAEDVQAMKAARPGWDADRCAQEVRDRGFYCREGYQWSVRVARTTLGA